jgi:hypothetical protein
MILTGTFFRFVLKAACWIEAEDQGETGTAFEQVEDSIR